MNSVNLEGRLTKDPELKKTKENDSWLAFTIAVPRRYKREGQPDADFISCTAFRQSADYLSKYAKKGDTVGVSGRLTTRSYDGQNGRVYVTEVACDDISLPGYRKEKTEPKEEKQDWREDADPKKFGGTFQGIDSDELPFY